jgi:hypothetical protein
MKIQVLLLAIISSIVSSLHRRKSRVTTGIGCLDKCKAEYDEMDKMIIPEVYLADDYQKAWNNICKHECNASESYKEAFSNSEQKFIKLLKENEHYRERSFFEKLFGKKKKKLI